MTPKTRLGRFSALVHKMARIAPFFRLAWTLVPETIDGAFSTASRRLSNMGFSGSREPFVCPISPGVLNLADTVADFTLQTAGLLPRPSPRLATGSSWRKGQETAGLTTFGSTESLVSRRNGKSPVISIGMEDQGFTSDMISNGLDKRQACIQTIGHEISHWIWQRERTFDLVFSTVKDKHPHIFKVIEIMVDPQKAAPALVACGMPANALDGVNLAVVGDEFVMAVDEAVADALGALSCDEPVLAWEASLQYRLKSACDPKTSHPRYLGIDKEHGKSISGAIATCRDKFDFYDRILPVIVDSCSGRLCSWLLGTPAEPPAKATLRSMLLAVCSADADIHPGPPAFSKDERPLWPSRRGCGSNDALGGVSSDTKLCSARLSLSLSLFPMVPGEPFPFYVEPCVADNAAQRTADAIASKRPDAVRQNGRP